MYAGKASAANLQWLRFPSVIVALFHSWVLQLRLHAVWTRDS
jgi:hypothetical protein